MQAKGTKSTPHVRNEVDLVPLAWEDASKHETHLKQLELSFAIIFKHIYLRKASITWRNCGTSGGKIINNLRTGLNKLTGIFSYLPFYKHFKWTVLIHRFKMHRKENQRKTIRREDAGQYEIYN